MAEGGGSKLFRSLFRGASFWGGGGGGICSQVYILRSPPEGNVSREGHGMCVVCGGVRGERRGVFSGGGHPLPHTPTRLLELPRSWCGVVWCGGMCRYHTVLSVRSTRNRKRLTYVCVGSQPLRESLKGFEEEPEAEFSPKVSPRAEMVV